MCSGPARAAIPSVPPRSASTFRTCVNATGSSPIKSSPHHNRKNTRRSLLSSQHDHPVNVVITALHWVAALRMAGLGSVAHMRGRGVSALLAVVWLGAAGCAGSGDASSQATPTTSSARPSASRSAPPSLEQSKCGPDFPYPDAPTYAGRGPHRVGTGDTAGDGRQNPVYQGLSAASLPEKWVAPELKSMPFGADPERAQLLICLTDVETQTEQAIGRCDFLTTSGNIYPATFTFQIYEVKTGRWIETLTIRSDEPAESTCPVGISYEVGSTVEVAQGIKDKTLRNRLRPLITGPARH
jgi:hypothetical protein